MTNSTTHSTYSGGRPHLSSLRQKQVIVAPEPPIYNIKKLIGCQLGSSPYCVKLSECFKVPTDEQETVLCRPRQLKQKKKIKEIQILSTPPNIPVTISGPVNENVPHHTTEEIQDFGSGFSKPRSKRLCRQTTSRFSYST